MPLGADELLPEPPIPPMDAPISQAAPLPNFDLEAPVSLGTRTAKVSLEWYRINRFDTSKGFAPGSRYQTNDERRPMQTPGLSVRVPLE